MDSRELVYRALRFEKPDRVPRDLWAVPGVEMFRLDELNQVADLYPTDITVPTSVTQKVVTAQSYFGEESSSNSIVFKYGKSERLNGTAFVVGTNIDEWGCEWQVGEDGVAGEVKRPLLDEWNKLDTFTAPWELINDADWSMVDRFCEKTDKFVITPWHVNPFERMQFLRGTENLYVDIALGRKEVFKLRDMVHEFFIKEIECWCKTKVDGIRFSDDWGMQTRLLINPKIWRELFKPIYSEYCRMAHDAGKFVFYHSDGNISAIISDLIEIGVDAMNLQLFCMDIEDLGKKYKGKVTIWGEIDRQHILPYGTPEEVANAVRRVRRALDTGSGGVIAQLEWGKLDPIENIMAAYKAWLEKLD
jgi:hypothetical protein